MLRMARRLLVENGSRRARARGHRRTHVTDRPRECQANPAGDGVNAPETLLSPRPRRAPGGRCSGSGCGRRSRSSPAIRRRLPDRFLGRPLVRAAAARPRHRARPVRAGADRAAPYPLFRVCAPDREHDRCSGVDRGSGVAHRPATAISDELAAGARRQGLAGAVAGASRARRRAARKFRAGAPEPGLALRDPFALRALVLILLVATFVAAGGDRVRRITAAFDWRGMVASANFRIDAWVTPPNYTGRPPVLLPGIRAGEPVREAQTIAVPAGSVLVVRATGVTLDIAAQRPRPRRRRTRTSARPTPAAPRSAASRSRNPARSRCAAPAATSPGRSRRSRTARRRSRSPRIRSRRRAAPAAHLPDRGRLRRHRRRGAAGAEGARRSDANAPRPLYGAPNSRWCCRRRARATASARPRRISPSIPGPASTSC